jgi:hypothetical protein
MNTCIYTYSYIRIDKYTYTDICRHKHIYLCIYIYTCTHENIDSCIYIYIHIYVYIYTYLHTYMYTYKDICRNKNIKMSATNIFKI